MNALILGGTGLVGNDLVELLISDNRLEKVELLSRRELDNKQVKVINHVVDFSTLTTLDLNGPIDVLFIAFGTTLKQAGSKAKQFEIDVDIPTRIMALAHSVGVENCVLISALGVSLKSPFFYSRMKAQLDENAKAIGFKKLVLIQPSVLDGSRKETRTGEKLSIQFGNILGKTGLINRFKPVKSLDVAKSMLQSVLDLPNGTHVVTSEVIPSFAKKYNDNSAQFHEKESI